MSATRALGWRFCGMDRVITVGGLRNSFSLVAKFALRGNKSGLLELHGITSNLWLDLVYADVLFANVDVHPCLLSSVDSARTRQSRRSRTSCTIRKSLCNLPVSHNRRPICRPGTADLRR